MSYITSPIGRSKSGQPKNPYISYILPTPRSIDGNFPDAEEREFDDLSPSSGALYRKGAIITGMAGIQSTGKGNRGINLTCRLLPPKEGDVGKVWAVLSKTKRDLDKFPLEPGCQLIFAGDLMTVVDFRFNSFPKYVALLLSSVF